MYTLQISTELMKNQKAAQLLSDQSQFDALQTSDGNALFFGIGDTGILYATQEQQSATTGWTPIDLTTELGALLPGLSVSAKVFAVSQNASTGDIVIAQVVHTAEDNQDRVFVLTGLSYAPDAAWLGPPTARSWLARAYDNTLPLNPLTLSYVELESNQDTQVVPYLIAGVVAPQTSYISNYQVSLDPTVTTGVWQQYVTAENYTQLLGMAIGMSQSSMAFGLYELYTLSGNTSLTFTPSGSAYIGPGPVVVTKMNPPAGASAIAVLPVDAQGHTNLYVAAGGSIYVFPPNQQLNTGTPTAIVTNPMVTGVNLLEVNVAGSQVTLWGRNGDGAVFYSRCAADQQTVASAWSAPIPIAQAADQVASLLNLETQASALFVHTSGQNLQKLTQDPVTTQWNSQSLLLPPLALDDVYECHTFTTHVDVLDENSMPSPATSFSISSTSPVPVYLNDVYTTLSNAAPLTVQSSQTGSVTIVQETRTIGAVCYKLVSGDGTIVNVNPMTALLATLKDVQSGSDLNVTVTDELGNQSPLVPSSVTSSQQNAVAQCVQQFVQVSQSLPSDGSVSLPAAARPLAIAASSATTPFGLSFANSDIQYISSGGDIGNAIEAFAGDVLHWIDQAIDDVVQFVVQVADSVAHFFITIGEDIYHFVLTCASDVMHGIQFIFQKIGVAFEKLVQWLGFVFAWNDILQTHAVVKNILNCYLQYSIGNLSTYKTGLTNLATTLQDKINTWADLPQPSQTLSSQVASAGPLPGKSNPAANWGTHQLNSNASGASTGYTPSDPDVSAFEQVFEDILSAITTEGQDMAKACAAIKTQIVDQISTLTLAEIIQKLFAIIADLVVETVQNLVIAIIDVLQAAVPGVLDSLTATIDIPVISWMYNKFTHSPLSFMDLVCLIMAIPVTIIYKIAHGTAPFPDDATSSALKSAADFPTIRQILSSSQAAAPAGARDLAAVPPLASAGDRWLFSANVLALAASIGESIFTGMKIYSPNNPIAAIGNSLCYIPYCAPDFGIAVAQTWYQIMNECITGISIVKTLLDMSLYKFQKALKTNSGFLIFWSAASPFLEFAISLAWMVPAVWTLSASTSVQTCVGVVSNVSFNATGIVGIFGTLDQEPVTKAVFTVIVVGTILVYGLGTFTSSFLANVGAAQLEAGTA